MGVCTGSDADIAFVLNKELMHRGLEGEGLVDSRVWVIKSHYPERFGNSEFFCDRAILLVRNPLDCIISLFHMVCTNSHHYSIHDDDFKTFNSLWQDFVNIEYTVWDDFHKFWLNCKVPIYIVRYEDILERPEPTMKGLVEFLLNVDDITGTKVHDALKQTVGQESPVVYKPRQGKILGNMDKYTDEMKALI